MRVALKFAYDGRNYHGYARQPNQRTIEGELIQQLTTSKIITNLEEAQFRIAARTDKNVSSLGNILVFHCKKIPFKELTKINAELSGIYLYGYKDVNPTFNPRHALMRQYRYYLVNNDFDIDQLIKAAQCFTGTHDFSNFARIESHRNPTRTIDNILITKQNSLIIFDIFAQTFLWHQIRRIISSIDKIGQNKIFIKDILNALENPRERVDFGLAHPDPLFLMNVQYDFEFHYLPNYRNQLSIMQEQIIRRLDIHSKSMRTEPQP